MFFVHFKSMDGFLQLEVSWIGSEGTFFLRTMQVLEQTEVCCQDVDKWMIM